jgi:acetylornithine deacetylase/succinyl-diaminopimelate desuccinylase-like protein
MNPSNASHESVFNAVEADRVVELAKLFCAMPSPEGEEGPFAHFLAEVLDRPGIEVHCEDVVKGRPNLVARVEGRGEAPPLVLNGHIDTAVWPDGWSHDPSDPWIEGNRLFGGGIADMKGALAAMAAAVEAAPAAGQLPGDLILHAVMHHDTIGLGAKFLMANEGPTEGFGICGEPSDLAIHTGNGGAIKWKIHLRGRAAHASRAETAVDALAAAVRVYGAVDELDFTYEPCERLPDLPRSHVGILHSGFSSGCVAGEAVIEGDVRTVPGMTRGQIIKSLRDVADAVAGDEVAITVTTTAVQKHFLGAEEGPLVEAITKAHTAALGVAPRVTNELPSQAFISDAADMAAAGLETVVYGVGSWHFAPDEWVDIDELVGSARTYLATAANLGSNP